MEDLGVLRILFLNNQGLDQSGGGVTILRHLVAHFSQGHEVLVLSQTRLAQEIDGVEQRVLPSPQVSVGPSWRIDPWRKARHWKRVLSDSMPQVDVVVALDCHFALALQASGSAARIYLSLSAIPRMEWFLGGSTGRLWRFLQYAWLERRAIGWADESVVSSASQAEEIRRFEALPAFRPHVIPPVFREFSRDSVFEESGESSATVVEESKGVTILAVSRLEPLKGLHVIPELAKRLTDLDCRFLIVGDGPERESLRSRVRALGVEDRVQLVGNVFDPEPLYRTSQILLHPSRYESFGMAIFEAMRHGLAVIAGAPTPRQFVAAPEFLEDRREGRLVDWEDLDGVAQIIREWIEQPARRRSIGEAAAERAETLLSQDYARAMELVLERAVQKAEARK